MSFATIDFNMLAKEIHQNNVAKGFWPNGVEGRNFGEVIALIHSEISEAAGATIAGDIDAHLPQYTAFAVEIMDAIIRLLDLSGAYGVCFEKRAYILYSGGKFTSVQDDLLEVHSAISSILEAHRRNDSDGIKLSMQIVLEWLLFICEKYALPSSALFEKIAYNTTRPSKHGKAY